MINVLQGVKKYGMGEPWEQAARELASHPETGKFMRGGEYAIVAIGKNFAFPPVFLTFISTSDVTVQAGEDHACFHHEDVTHCLWRIHALDTNPDQVA